MKIVTNEFDYQVNQNESYSLKVNIGGGDTGTITIKKPSGEIISHIDTIECELGLGSELKGKKMLISVTISDVHEDGDSVIGIDFNSTPFKTLTETVVNHELLSNLTTINFK